MAYINEKNPIVNIHVKDFGNIILQLFPEVAPNTVANFITYVKDNYYNGLIFHRIIKGFMIQGGWGSSKYAPIAGEFTQNGIKNDLTHQRGVISMARTLDPNSQTAQFFIVHKDSPHLDGAYAAFGQVTEGLDVVDKIAQVRKDAYDKPYEDVLIEKISFDLKDYVLPAVTYYKK